MGITGIQPASRLASCRRGPRACRRYFLTAEKFDAATAERLGLVHRVVEPEALGAARDATGPQAAGIPGCGYAARIEAMIAKYKPPLALDATMNFRNQTGGFDLQSIEKSEPRHLEFRVAELPVVWRNDAATRVSSWKGFVDFADLLRIRANALVGRYQL